jgi:hypothetical protein
MRVGQTSVAAFSTSVRVAITPGRSVEAVFCTLVPSIVAKNRFFSSAIFYSGARFTWGGYDGSHPRRLDTAIPALSDFRTSTLCHLQNPVAASCYALHEVTR